MNGQVVPAVDNFESPYRDALGGRGSQDLGRSNVALDPPGKFTADTDLVRGLTELGLRPRAALESYTEEFVLSPDQSALANGSEAVKG